jgi:sulfur carrier protein
VTEERIRSPDPGGARSAGERPSDDRWVLVNGRRRPWPAHGNLVQLLRQLGIDPDAPGIALAVNEAVLRRPEWARRCLAPGDRVEVVRAVQGG